MDKTDSPGFISRWSRRKQGVLDEAAVVESDAGQTVQSSVNPDRDVVPERGSESVAVNSSESDAAELAAPAPLTDADMPDLDGLNEGDDFSGFLSEGVSEALRRKALKKLFSLPDFQINDGLNDYDEDYSTFVPLGDTVTYQMKQWLERQKSAFNEALEEDGVEVEVEVKGEVKGEVEAETDADAADELAASTSGPGRNTADGAATSAGRARPQWSVQDADGLGEAEEG